MKNIKVINKKARDNRWESQKTHSSRVEIFAWLHRDRFNNMNIDGV